MTANLVIFLIAAATVLVPALLGSKYGLVRYVSPLQVVALMAFLGVFVKAVAYIFTPEQLFISRFYIDKGTVQLGYVFVFLFCLAISLGYIGVASRYRGAVVDCVLLSTLAVKTTNKALLLCLALVTFLAVAKSLFVAYGIGDLTELFSVSAVNQLNAQKLIADDTTRGFGRTLSFNKFFLVVVYSALALYFALFAIERTFTNLLFVCAAALLSVYAAMLTGSRNTLIQLFLMLFGIWVLLGKPVNLAASVKFGCLGVGIVVSFWVMTVFREYGADTSGFVVEFSETFRPMIESTYFMDVNTAAIFIEKVDSNDLLFGQSYFRWLYGWVPRDLWPGKPAVSLGYYVKTEVLEMQSGLGGVNVTGPGEALLNFGWLGVLCGIGLGALYRLIEEVLLGNGGRLKKVGLWVYPVSAMPFFIGSLQSSFSATLVTSVANVFIVLFVSRVATAKFRWGVDRK